MRTVLAPAPTGLTYAHPVRRPHARPGVFGLVDERLQQPGAIAVEALAVVANRPSGPAQHVGGQVAARDVGTYQQPAQSQHPVQVSAPARVVPADPGVAGPGAAHTPRTRPRPASHARSPPDTAVEGRQRARRRAGAHAPSACSRPGAARRSPPAPAPSPGPRRPCQAPQPPAPPGAGSTRGRHTPPQEGRPRGSETWPAASRSANAAQQLARCHRPRPSRKSNALQTRSATCPRPSMPCDTAPSSTSRSLVRLPAGCANLILNLHARHGSEAAS